MTALRGSDLSRCVFAGRCEPQKMWPRRHGAERSSSRFEAAAGDREKGSVRHIDEAGQGVE